MFYCNTCGNRIGWPVEVSIRSYGCCEICHHVADCNDVPSLFLSSVRRINEENVPPFPYEILS